MITNKNGKITMDNEVKSLNQKSKEKTSNNQNIHIEEPLLINAPVSGTLLQHTVPEGADVKKGDAVIIIESMKMELVLKAPVSGIINFHKKAGDLFYEEETLASIQSLSKDDNSDFEKEDKSYVYGFIKGTLVGLAIILSYLICF